MNAETLLVVSLSGVVGLAIGALLVRLLGKSKFSQLEQTLRAQYESEIIRRDERLIARNERLTELSAALAEAEERQAQVQRVLLEKEALVSELGTRLEEERKSSEERNRAFEQAKEVLLDSFKALSADALRTNNESFLELAKQNLSAFQEGAKGELERRAQAIDELVKPLRESLFRVDEKIGDLEKSRSTAYTSLHEQVKALIDTQQGLRTETGNLVRALRSPSQRGRWGEIQLRRVVELAGMVDHCDFYEQESLDTEEGRRRPDMVIRLPNGREIVVDAKVPIEAYLNAIEAVDDDTRKILLKDHARQLRDHVTKLGQKSYWQHFQSPEFTVLFLSGENFFTAALEHDPTLIEFGVERQVIVATPITLISLLRAVHFGWRQESLAEHARSIQELGTQLHDRMRTMVEHILKVRKGLDNAVQGYNEFIRSFDSRVLVSARKLKELDAGGSREIAEVHEIETHALVTTTQHLSISELGEEIEAEEKSLFGQVSGIAVGAVLESTPTSPVEAVQTDTE